MNAHPLVGRGNGRVILGELDAAAARTFGLSEDGIAQCERILDRGELPMFDKRDLYPWWANSLVVFVLGFVCSIIATRALVALGLDPGFGVLAALVAGTIVMTFFVRRTHRMVYGIAGLVTAHSSGLDATDLWLEALEAYDDASETARAQILPMLADLRQELLPLARTRTTSISVEDTVSRIVAMADTQDAAPASLGDVDAFARFLDTVNPEDFDDRSAR